MARKSNGVIGKSYPENPLIISTAPRLIADNPSPSHVVPELPAGFPAGVSPDIGIEYAGHTLPDMVTIQAILKLTGFRDLILSLEHLVARESEGACRALPEDSLAQLTAQRKLLRAENCSTDGGRVPRAAASSNPAIGILRSCF